MASSIIRRSWFGWLNPNAPSQTTPKTATASTVTLGFANGPILPAAPALAQFACTVNGVARGVTAAACAASNLTLTLASAVTAGQTVIVTYTPNGANTSKCLQDSGGDLVSAFTVSIVAT